MYEARLFAAVELLSGAILYILVFVSVFYLLRLLPARPRRLAFTRFYRGFAARKRPPKPLLQLLGISPESERLGEKSQMLAGAGLGLDILWYTVGKRLALCLLMSASAWGFYTLGHPSRSFNIPPLQILCVSGTAISVLLFDRALLAVLKKQRADRIVGEIYLLSNQLLYYTGSKMNLHGKLELCVPFTRTIRQDFRLLLNDWYQDSGKAIQDFKHRLGTEDGYSFAETLNSLRLYENDDYYDLLRKRIQDYKDKLEMIRDSKKETASYLLFILAGIPILNTFRLFIYPWVQEGQKLFQSLN